MIMLFQLVPETPSRHDADMRYGAGAPAQWALGHEMEWPPPVFQSWMFSVRIVCVSVTMPEDAGRYAECHLVIWLDSSGHRAKVKIMGVAA